MRSPPSSCARQAGAKRTSRRVERVKNFIEGTPSVVEGRRNRDGEIIGSDPPDFKKRGRQRESPRPTRPGALDSIRSGGALTSDGAAKPNPRGAPRAPARPPPR